MTSVASVSTVNLLIRSGYVRRSRCLWCASTPRRIPSPVRLLGVTESDVCLLGVADGDWVLLFSYQMNAEGDDILPCSQSEMVGCFVGLAGYLST